MRTVSDGRWNWTLVDELLSMQDDFNRLFAGGPAAGYALRQRYPLVNVWESADGLIVDAELPGVDPAAVEIAVADGKLTLSGKRAAEATEDATYRRRERQDGAFSRSFELPYRVQADAVKATYKDGVLRITLPRAEVDKPRRIAVEAA